MTTLLRVERHLLGPRLYVLGRRVHEWHIGAGLVVIAALAEMRHATLLHVGALAVLALWLIVKDWRDIHPATRDTAAWSPGMHRLPGVPARRLEDRVPALAAAATAVVGAINVASAMTAELPWRVRDLLAIAPIAEVRAAHALAVPAGLALVAAAWPLLRRRRRALRLAVALLVALGALDMLKGLDVEEAAVSWALAAILWRARTAFWVAHEPAIGPAVRRATAVLAAVPMTATCLVWVAAPFATPPLERNDAPATALRLLLSPGATHFRDPFDWLALGVPMLAMAAIAAAAATVLAPLRPRRVADCVDRHRAADLVRRYGGDTLSAFKLRRDVARRWSADGRAMAAYRIEAGALLLAGDPVGARDAVPGLLRELIADARRHGLAFGCVGASDAFALQARAAGVHRLYLGDEAMVRTGDIDLSGGARKSLRKAVNRVSRNGFTAALHSIRELDPGTIEALHAVSDRWRDGVDERGFSMAHDCLVDELLPDAQVVIGRDADGRVRGFLQFVPVFGRPAVSLAFMRRDRDTPNGLMDFLVVEAARLLAGHGVEEFSLNFASYGRWLREPANVVERALAVALRRADRFFQIERLLRFNAKFEPRWQPRYLLFERPTALPRIALAAMWAEGQLPRAPLTRRPLVGSIAQLAPVGV